MPPPIGSSFEERSSADVKGAKDLSTVVSQLLDRVRLLEDRAEIASLIAAYGPLVDAADGQGVAGLWALTDVMRWPDSNHG